MGQTQTKNKHKKEPKFDSSEEYFINNGGVFLEKQLALCRGQNIRPRQLKTLSINEIEKAINNYDDSLVVASIQSIVYKAIIDDRVLVVKVPTDFHINPLIIDLYLTEAATSMVMTHQNMVKIYGCCLETYIPIMVFEYLPNGSLFRHLHINNARIKWSDRLTVASDTAYALSYMHNALSNPVVHRDVQSFSILLDESFRAKLSNLGYSVSIIPGEKCNEWPVLGSPGYIDPEYVETGEVTEKCDVYSFGVLLLELSTGKQPIRMARDGSDLVDMFVSAVEKNGVMEMIEKEVLEEARDDEIKEVVRLALMCVGKKGEDRPSMINVVQRLWEIQDRDENRKGSSETECSH